MLFSGRRRRDVSAAWQRALCLCLYTSKGCTLYLELNRDVEYCRMHADDAPLPTCCVVVVSDVGVACWCVAGVG